MTHAPLTLPLTRGVGLDCEVVTTRAGARAVRDRLTGELMHPVTGPIEEAERIYIVPARVRERLGESTPGRPLVLLDIGLGAGSNALAAWKASHSSHSSHSSHARDDAKRTLEIVSFDRSLAAFSLALAEENAEAFGFVGESLAAASAVLESGEHSCRHTRWRYVDGELPLTLETQAAGMADIVFWDPFSPRANPQMWTVAAFAALRRVCRAGVAVHTFSGATAIRSAMLLAGFAVGFGPVTGDNKRATVGAFDARELAEPLDRRWFERLGRSSAAFPVDAPPDALERIGQLPQFAVT